MIKTGLPYNMAELNKIKENETVVDMSDINFPSIEPEKQKRASIIFLRNTGFDVKLDFSKCTFEEKEEFLKLYLTENIDIKYSEFSSSYIKILNQFVGNEVNEECILNKEEIAMFINNNNEFILNIIRLIKSLPLFAMFYFVLNDKAYDLNEFKKTEDDTIKTNFAHIVAHDNFLFLFDCDVNIEPLFYTKIFTIGNDELLNALKKLPFFEILYGLSSMSTEEWNAALNDADMLLNETNMEGEG